MRAAKHPTEEGKYAIGVLSRWQEGLQIFSRIDIYIADLTAGSGKIYLNSTDFWAPIRYVSSLRVVGNITNQSRITRFDITWRDPTTIVVACIRQYPYRADPRAAIIDRYSATVWSFNLLTNTWTNLYTYVAESYGEGYDVRITFQMNKIFIALISSEHRFVGYVPKLAFRMRLFSITESGIKSPIVDLSRTRALEGTPYFGHLSDIIFVSNNILVVASLVSSIGSEIISVLWDGIYDYVYAYTVLSLDALINFNLTWLFSSSIHRNNQKRLKE